MTTFLNNEIMNFSLNKIILDLNNILLFEMAICTLVLF